MTCCTGLPYRLVKTAKPKRHIDGDAFNAWTDLCHWYAPNAVSNMVQLRSWFNICCLETPTLDPDVWFFEIDIICKRMSEVDPTYAKREQCQNMRFNLVVLTYHTKSDYWLTNQGQTSDAPLKSSTITQGLRPHHFVQVFVNVYSLLLFLFLELLNDLHINTVSLQQGDSKDITIYIEKYKEYEADPLSLIQRVKKSSKSHLSFRLTK